MNTDVIKVDISLSGITDILSTTGQLKSLGLKNLAIIGITTYGKTDGGSYQVLGNCTREDMEMIKDLKGVDNIKQIYISDGELKFIKEKSITSTNKIEDDDIVNILALTDSDISDADEVWIIINRLISKGMVVHGFFAHAGAIIGTTKLKNLNNLKATNGIGAVEIESSRKFNINLKGMNNQNITARKTGTFKLIKKSKDDIASALNRIGR